MRRSDRLARWGPVVVWAAVIFAFSSVPSLSSGLGTWDLVLRKAAHVVEFAVLGALLARALPSLRSAIVLGSLYALTDEVHQVFVPGRVGSPLDWGLDTAGVVAGALAWARLAR